MAHPADPIHLEGLLHLATLSFAFTVAYLGFDRLSNRRDIYYDELAKVQEEIREELRVDGHLSTEGALALDREIVRGRKEIYLLCVITKTPNEVFFPNRAGWKECCKCLHRDIGGRIAAFLACLFGLPGFHFFDNRWDRLVVGILSVVSGVLFFMLVDISLWPEKFAAFDDRAAREVYWAHVAVIATVILVVMASGGLICRLRKKKEKWRVRMRDLTDAVFRAGTSNLNGPIPNPGNGGGNGGPSTPAPITGAGGAEAEPETETNSGTLPN